MSILFVCHSAGDTEIIIDTAHKVLSQTTEPVHILAVGKTAVDKIKSDRILYSRLIKLSTLLSEEDARACEDAPLSCEQVDIIQHHLASLDIKRALIGTPSQPQAAVPFQIAKKLSDTLENGIIYNNYLYHEEKHIFWKTLQDKKKWQTKFNWFFPTKDAKSLADRIIKGEESKELAGETTPTPTFVVGHRSIDAIFNPPAEDNKKAAAIRERLQGPADHSLLFVSSSKNTADDKNLLEALLTTIHANDNFANIQVRLGLHPGHTHLNQYVVEMLSVIEKFKESPLYHKVKFILPPMLNDKVDVTTSNLAFFCQENISGDDAAFAADGVACAVPATLTNKAALLGKPAYYHQEDKSPFLPRHRLIAGQKSIGLFLDRVSTRKNYSCISKEEIGLPNQPAAKIMAAKLLGKEELLHESKPKLPIENKPPSKPPSKAKASGPIIGAIAMGAMVAGLIIATAISSKSTRKMKP